MSGNVAKALIGDPAAVPLHDLQRVDANRVAPGIVRRLGLNLVNFFRGQHLLSSSPVDIRQHKIQAAQNDHQIRDHQTPRQQRQRLYMSKRRSPYACAV